MPNRVIKFRAWDGEHKEMRVVDAMLRSGEVMSGEDAFKPEALMQFTGFTQKGVEIYEGDILESDREWWRVDWDKDGGQWYCSGLFDGEDFALAEIVGDKDMTVEGNIYENPELIEKSV